MNTIYKCPLKVTSVQNIKGTGQEETKRILTHGNGEWMPDEFHATYIGTYQVGEFVFHVFEG